MFHHCRQSCGAHHGSAGMVLSSSGLLIVSSAIMRHTFASLCKHCARSSVAPAPSTWQYNANRFSRIWADGSGAMPIALHQNSNSVSLMVSILVLVIVFFTVKNCLGGLITTHLFA